MAETSRHGKTVLLRGPTLSDSADEAVYDALCGTDPAETDLLVVSYQRGPDAWLQEWARHVGERPGGFDYVHVGGATRSAAATASGGGGLPLAATAVRDLADLTELGIQISEILERRGRSDRRLVVYFETLTSLLEFVELERAYRFLHVLTGRTRSVGGTFYARLDDDAHDERTVATLQTLVDDSVELV